MHELFMGFTRFGARLIFRPAKNWAGQQFALKAISTACGDSHIYMIVRVLTGFIFGVAFVPLAIFLIVLPFALFFTSPSGNTPTLSASGGQVVLIVFATFIGFVYACTLWIDDYYRDPVVQRKNAGSRAEHAVSNLLDKFASPYGKSRPLHSLVFFFHQDTASEYSAEIDHLLITRKHIYLIETKYKSGKIAVDAESESWVTTTRSGVQGKMRNALLQAKNSARILQRECNLPVSPIPVVAIHGNEVEISGGVSNVVATHNLLDFIKLFETTGKNTEELNPDGLAETLIRFSSKDAEALERHVQRIKAAEERRAQERQINAASIDL